MVVLWLTWPRVQISGCGWRCDKKHPWKQIAPCLVDCVKGCQHLRLQGGRGGGEGGRGEGGQEPPASTCPTLPHCVCMCFVLLSMCIALGLSHTHIHATAAAAAAVAIIIAPPPPPCVQVMCLVLAPSLLRRLPPTLTVRTCGWQHSNWSLKTTSLSAQEHCWPR